MILTDDNPGIATSRVATVGTFDGVHRGHRCLLCQLTALARSLDMQSAVVTFSRHPRAIISGSGSSLLSPVSDKLQLISSAGVDDIILLDFNSRLRRLTAAEFMAYLHNLYGVKAMLLGFNNRFGSDRPASIDDYRREGKRVGVDVYIASPLDGINVSSTAIRDALAAGDVTRAAKMLGRCYTITGRVVHGQALGRTIGFPTANILPTCDNTVVPGRGVYAADVALPDGRVCRAIMNIGHRPTVASDATDTIEVHILNYSGDLYGSTVTVIFLSRLRDERRFPDLESLRLQLAADAAAAKNIKS